MMLKWLVERFSKKAAPYEPAPQLTPADIEAAISEAGRDEVFALVRANGWSPSNPPPHWVWIQASYEVRLRRTKPPITLH